MVDFADTWSDMDEYITNVSRTKRKVLKMN